MKDESKLLTLRASRCVFIRHIIETEKWRRISAALLSMLQFRHRLIQVLEIKIRARQCHLPKPNAKLMTIDSVARTYNGNCMVLNFYSAYESKVWVLPFNLGGRRWFAACCNVLCFVFDFFYVYKTRLSCNAWTMIKNKQFMNSVGLCYHSVVNTHLYQIGVHKYASVRRRRRKGVTK